MAVPLLPGQGLQAEELQTGCGGPAAGPASSAQPPSCPVEVRGLQTAVPPAGGLEPPAAPHGSCGFGLLCPVSSSCLLSEAGHQRPGVS